MTSRYAQDRSTSHEGNEGLTGAPGSFRGPSRADGASAAIDAEDEFRSAAPPPPPPLPDESMVDVASREGAAPLSRRLSRERAADGPPLPPLVAAEVLVGRLLRPTPLAANRNAVVASTVEGMEVEPSIAPESHRDLASHAIPIRPC